MYVRRAPKSGGYLIKLSHSISIVYFDLSVELNEWCEMDNYESVMKIDVVTLFCPKAST